MKRDCDNIKVNVTVPGDTHSLALVRKIITHLAADAGFPEEDVDKIEIAVDEACTNAMEHAYSKVSPPPPVRLEVSFENDTFVVDIIDEGTPFDFDSWVAPEFPHHWDQGNTRGVGLYLMQQCMDETQYESLPGQTNRLRLIKRLTLFEA